jgi:hypothetical protein
MNSELEQQLEDLIMYVTERQSRLTGRKLLGLQSVHKALQATLGMVRAFNL